MLGTIINVITVILGGTIGTFFGNRIRPEYSETFIKVMVPNAASSFLTVFLFSIVWYWNDYYVASSFFTNTKTISLVLKNLDGILNIEIFNNANANISAREKIVWLEAGCLISITPMLILYACLQKHFTEGIERSGIVG